MPKQGLEDIQAKARLASSEVLDPHSERLDGSLQPLCSAWWVVEPLPLMPSGHGDSDARGWGCLNCPLAALLLAKEVGWALDLQGALTGPGP